MEWQLPVAAGAEAIAAGAYAGVAAALSRRKVAPVLAPAHRGFMVWWLGAAAYSATTAMLLLVVIDGRLPSRASLLIHTLRVALLAAAAGGLLFYVLFLYRPAPRLQWPIGLYYGLLGAWTIAWAWRRGPVHFHAHDWYLELHYAQRMATFDLALVVVLFAGPLLAGIVLYLGLLARTTEPVLRRRIGLVGWSLLAWLGGTVAAVGADSDLGLLLASVAMGIVSAVAVMMAYARPDPPAA